MPYADPSIIQSYQPVELPDQGNLLLKALQVQGARSQNQLLNLQVGQQQQSADATNRINAGLAAHPEWQSDPGAMRSGLLGIGGTYAAPVLKNFLDTQKTQGQVDTSATDLSLKKKNAVDQAVGSLTSLGPNVTHQDVFATVRGLVNSKVLSSSEAQADLADMPQDPAQLPAWLAKSQQRGLTSEQQVTQNNPALMETDQGIVAAKKNGSGGSLLYPTGTASGAPGSQPPTQSINQPFVGRQPAGNFAGDPQTILAGLQRISDPNDRAGALRAFQNQLAGANPTLDANGIFQGTGAAAPVSINGGQAQQGQSSALALGAKPSGTWEVDPLTGQRVYAPKYANAGDVLNPQGTGGSLSAPDQAIAEKIASYEMAPPSLAGMKNPRIANIMAAVADQHPEYDATQYATKQAALKQFTPSGKAGMTVRSLSVASDHLDTLASAADAMKNGNLPLVNQVANFFGTQTGNTSQGAFNAVKNIVGDEVVKAVVGSAGGVSDREELKKSLNDAQTPQQLADVIRRYRELMGAQKSALQADYENSTGKTDFTTRFNYKKSGGAAPSSPAGWSIEKVN